MQTIRFCSRLRFCALCLLFSLAGTLQAQEWKLVWSDEFNTEGPPDSGSWNYERGFVRNEELQWYQPGNAYCRGGLLIIEGRKEKVPNPRYNPQARDWRTSRQQADYTSSSITTRNKRSFLYGRFEVRARFRWPADPACHLGPG